MIFNRLYNTIWTQPLSVAVEGQAERVVIAGLHHPGGYPGRDREVVEMDREGLFVLVAQVDQQPTGLGGHKPLDPQGLVSTDALGCVRHPRKPRAYQGHVRIEVHVGKGSWVHL